MGVARKRTLTIVAVVLVVVLLGAGTAAFLLWERTARGSLVSLTTGRPISGATIRSGSVVVTTDASGRFALAKLRLGRQSVSVTAEGFPPFEAELKVRAIGVTESRIKLPDASVTVHIEEVALQPKEAPSAKAKVLIGGAEASRTASGTYQLKGLRPGETAIAVRASSYEPTETTLTLEPGVNDVRVGVYLTPAETYSRYFEAWKSAQWSAAYAYLHPDAAKRESLATFTKDMKDWGMPVSITMNGTRMLASWTSPSTSVTYKNVAEIRRTLITQRQGWRMQSALPQHWVNVGGLWLRVDL